MVTAAPDARFERWLARGGRIVAGVDEVGRGAWAGPLTACVAVWHRRMLTSGARDSKQLTPVARERVFAVLAPAVAHGIGHTTPSEIDQLGMTLALRLASMRALRDLHETHALRPDVVILDGNYDFLAGVVESVCVVAADARCVSAAAASVLAKVTRDRLMACLAPSHAPYGFELNKGYPAPVHRAALREVGPCPIHRRSWAPIRELLGADAPERGACLPVVEPELFTV